MPASCAFGTSGSRWVRCGAVYASARSFPLFTSSMAPLASTTAKSTVPESVTLIASPAPL
ncbi:hypothetical protein D3C81_1954580 [compost metagenome]